MRKVVGKNPKKIIKKIISVQKNYKKNYSDIEMYGGQHILGVLRVLVRSSTVHHLPCDVPATRDEGDTRKTPKPRSFEKTGRANGPKF